MWLLSFRYSVFPTGILLYTRFLADLITLSLAHSIDHSIPRSPERSIRLPASRVFGPSSSRSSQSSNARLILHPLSMRPNLVVTISDPTLILSANARRWRWCFRPPTPRFRCGNRWMHFDRWVDAFPAQWLVSQSTTFPASEWKSSPDCCIIVSSPCSATLRLCR